MCIHRIWNAFQTTTSPTRGGILFSTLWRGMSKLQYRVPTTGPPRALRTPVRSTPWYRAQEKSDNTFIPLVFADPSYCYAEYVLYYYERDVPASIVDRRVTVYYHCSIWCSTNVFLCSFDHEQFVATDINCCISIKVWLGSSTETTVLLIKNWLRRVTSIVCAYVTRCLSVLSAWCTKTAILYVLHFIWNTLLFTLWFLS